MVVGAAPCPVWELLRSWGAGHVEGKGSGPRSVAANLPSKLAAKHRPAGPLRVLGAPEGKTAPGTRKVAVTTWTGGAAAGIRCDWSAHRAQGFAPGPPRPAPRARGHWRRPGLGRGGAPRCQATARHRPQ